MKVHVASEAGFCFGVKRALKIINQLHEEKQGIQIYGQLIHNRTVLDDLKAKGIDCIESLDQLDPQQKLVIRTHGIPRELEEKFKNSGADYADATCPLVKKLHHIIDKLEKKHIPIVIVGNRAHPEIIAARSHTHDALVIDSEAEADAVKRSKTLGVVAQTTLDADHYKEIVSRLVDKAEKLEVYNTICQASRVRQEAIKDLAPKVDCVVVVGGKNSSNTKKLYNIALKRNKNSFHVENSDELLENGLLEQLKQFESVGITAGASTPPEEIKKTKKILTNIN